jgi:transglutaminase-like putative cysteine protease
VLSPFRGGADLLAAVSSWVGSQLRYVPGSSGPTDRAVDTLFKRPGVCCDYARLVIALLCAWDVPARLAAGSCKTFATTPRRVKAHIDGDHVVYLGLRLGG